MGLLHWEALQRLNALHQHLYDLLHHLLQTSCQSTLWTSDSFMAQPTAIRVWETDTDIILDIEVPNGMTDQMEVELTEETVLIRGRRSRHHEPQSYFDFEFYTDRFQSLIPLPTLIVPQTAQVKLQGHCLTLMLQKSWRLRQPVKLNVGLKVGQTNWPSSEPSSESMSESGSEAAIERFTSLLPEPS